MDSQRYRRMNVESDRLSGLSDDLIVKILSYNGIKQAVQTSVLSSRWKSIWTSVPYLNFSSEDFPNKTPKFCKFLIHVFTSCNDQVEFSLNLRGKVSQVFVNKILNDTFSRNIQKLTFKVLHEKQIKFDLSIFTSQSLKHLTLTGSTEYGFITLKLMWKLPALTTLHLDHVTLYDDNTPKCVGLFSKCPNLKDLTLDNCRVMGLNSFTISHTQLSNLTIKNRKLCLNVVNVITPQLKNLTIINVDGEHKISAPQLTSLLYKNESLQLSIDIDSLLSLEKADLLCICNTHDYTACGAHKVVDLLQKFNNVKFLTLSLEIIELLSFEVKLISHQPSPFVNLRSLRIYPEFLDKSFNEEDSIPTEVKNYLLECSSSATLTTVSRKELRAVRDAKSAQDLMEELRLLLNKEKTLMKSHKAVMRPELMTKMPLDMSTRVMRIENYWEDLNEQIYKGKRKTIPIIKLIQRIKDLLKNLPISKKADMQPDFTSLCAEADTVINKIVKRMKIVCDKKESSLSLCFRKLTTAAKSSS